MAETNYGLVGLAVMGANLTLNFAHHGIPMAVYNRTSSVTEKFLAGEAQGKPITGADNVRDFIGLMQRPRRIIILVKAGPAVDAVINELRPFLEEGDVIIDGGNSFFQDTIRRDREFQGTGLYFVGMGVSGGEEGARYGPSLMPGGPREAYDLLEPALSKVAAQVADGPCVTYIGPHGAGHYVKTVHNGIEYGDIQLIAETYNIMKHALGLSAPEMSEIFARWNEGRLNSFLVEIASTVLGFIDADTDKPLVDLILDEAEQKGTGRWTSQNAIELGVPIPTIDAAVWSRGISALKEERVHASSILQGPRLDGSANGSGRYDREHLINALESALYAAKVSSYAQGFALLRIASDTYGFELNLSELARIWKGGCIIRAELLNTIQQAFEQDPSDRPMNLLLAPHFAQEINNLQSDWRYVTGVARELGVPTPAMNASLDYYDSYRAERLPANLVQGLRDLFGAHTYRRVDKEGYFHTQWEARPEPELVEAVSTVPPAVTGEDDPVEQTTETSRT